MYERTLQSAVRYLATVPQHTVSIQELWEATTRETRAVEEDLCALPDFAALLDADPRFHLLNDGFGGDVSYVESDGPEDSELSDLGFSPSCLVTLRRGAEQDDGEDIPSIVHRHLSETKPVRRVRAKGAPGQAQRRTSPKGRSTTAGRQRKSGSRRRRS